MKRNIKILTLAVLLAIGYSANSQKTSGNIAKQNIAKPGSGGSGAIKLIDNKGTIKYLQANNGMTMLTNDANGDVTTTTWQLGGSLTEDTYIDVNGKVFALNKLELVTDINTASTNTDKELNGSTSGGSTTGFTILVRDEATGSFKKIRALDLLQVQSGQTVLNASSTPAATGKNSIPGLPSELKNVSVYRNGAKLIAGVDYKVYKDELEIVDRSSAIPPLSWTLYPTEDTIEVQWFK